jgi:S-adenosylmethionine hydrolase
MPILTLTTDVGLNDYIVAAVKGQMLSAIPSLQLVDISHTLSPFNYLQTAYICKSAFQFFPSQTIHLVLINLFETASCPILVCYFHQQFIICPDNGILTMICGCKPSEVIRLSIADSPYKGTLHITHSIAQAIAQLANGKAFTTLGTIANSFEEKYPLRATVGPNWIEGQIIFIDNFENVVVNISYEEFEELRQQRSFKIHFTRNETIHVLSENYGAVAPGEKIAWFNSAGYLELAINKGNMAGLFGLENFSEKNQRSAAIQNQLLYQTVRIMFE